MSDTATPRRTKFGTQLRAELDRQRLSIRKLARTLDPQKPDVARRNLARWIGGYNQPSRIHRIAVAEALGLPPDAFLSDEDEEAEPVAFGDAMQRMFERSVDAAVERKLSSLGVRP